MTLHSLPAEFEKLAERARVALDGEIAAAKNFVAAAVTEKNAAQTALAELREQHAQAQKQLDAVNNELGRRMTLAAVNREIVAGDKKLEAQKAEMAEVAKAVAALNKQRAEADTRLAAIGNEAQRMLGIRAEAESVMSKIRSQLGLVQQ
jgi:chromosome segregation ATPase